MKTAIVWFKSNLRLHDNETLVRAIAQSDQIIPFYCIDESQFQLTDLGFRKMGSFRAQFLLESLIDLDMNLKAIGSGLLLVKGKPEEEIVKIVEQYTIQKVFVKSEVADEEIQTQELVKIELLKRQCALEIYDTSTLYHAEDLPFSMNDIPEVYSNFRMQVEKGTLVRPLYSRPTLIKSPRIQPLNLPLMKDLGLVFNPIDDRAAIKFRGGETEGCKRLLHYLFESMAISSYKETRNGMIGANYSSKFSAWLSMGCLSPREIYWQIKDFEAQSSANESTYWLVFELIWRDYFRFMMKKYRYHFFLQNGIKTNKSMFNYHDSEIFKTWKTGRTGNDFIDANMLELKLTGFMSNRGRQNVASYLCHNLNLDWRYGAAYIEEQLIDYDVSSNWCNWAYIAGVGNNPRINREFNIEKQANDYDKDRKYRDLWLNKI